MVVVVTTTVIVVLMVKDGGVGGAVVLTTTVAIAVVEKQTSFGVGSNNMEEEIDRERFASTELKNSENPKLLSKAAGKKSCSIFRVPPSLIEVNGKAYQPRIVSIGPYHRAQPRLNMIEEHKWRYLGSLLSRTHTIGLSLEDLFKARECYSETIHLARLSRLHRNDDPRRVFHH
ncbi:UPF0481 protein [Spatholobus suberectus]|nr:UPF0481 protein [Spatholobus suberectus]